MLRVPVRKLDDVLVESERLHHGERKIDARLDLRFDLLRHAEDVRVILREAAHAQQAVQHARALVAIHGAQLGQAHRQLAIAAQARFVNQDVARAIHGLELVVVFLDFDRAEHILAIKIGVAAGLPQFQAHDVRRVHQIVAAAQQFVAQPVFHHFADQAALGMPENQPRPGLFLNGKQVQLLPEPAMIAPLGLFQPVQIFVQLLLRVEARAVDALHLRIAFLAFPVGARDAHQLERANAPGRRDVRPAAEIDEFSGGVERHHRLDGALLHQFALEALIPLAVQLERFGLRHHLALVGNVLRRELAHFLFDALEIFGREGLRRARNRRKSRCRSAGRCPASRSGKVPAPPRRASAPPSAATPESLRDLSASGSRASRPDRSARANRPENLRRLPPEVQPRFGRRVGRFFSAAPVDALAAAAAGP